MFGVFVNVLAIVVGGIIGTLAKQNMSKRISDTVMDGIGLFSVFIGIQGAMKGEKSIVVLIALIVGTIIGSAIDIDKYVVLFGSFLKKKFINEKNPDSAKFIDAFVSASVLFGIGALAILGSIEAGIKHEYSIFFLKSFMDFVSAIMFATTMGIGVSFSAITVLILQGGMTLFAGLIKPLAENTAMMNELTCCGNILIIAISLNILGIKQIKIANMLPAILLTPVIYYIGTMI